MVLDAIRAMVFGPEDKAGGYVNSQRYVIKAKLPEDQQPPESKV